MECEWWYETMKANCRHRTASLIRPNRRSPAYHNYEVASVGAPLTLVGLFRSTTISKPPIGILPVSDTESLPITVRKVEFRRLHVRLGADRVARASILDDYTVSDRAWTETRLSSLALLGMTVVMGAAMNWSSSASSDRSSSSRLSSCRHPSSSCLSSSSSFFCSSWCRPSSWNRFSSSRLFSWSLAECCLASGNPASWNLGRRPTWRPSKYRQAREYRKSFS